MLPLETSKEVTVLLKYGRLRNQQLVVSFKSVTWSCNEQKPYLTYPGLVARLKNAFSSVSEPFQIVIIGN